MIKLIWLVLVLLQVAFDPPKDYFIRLHTFEHILMFATFFLWVLPHLFGRFVPQPALLDRMNEKILTS